MEQNTKREQLSLQQLIRLNYRSLSEFNRKLGWNYSKTYRIVTGRQDPTVIEAWDLGKALGVEEAGDIWPLFLRSRKSTKRDNGPAEA